MNDCIWCFIEICYGEKCRSCKDYISVNCDLGDQMREAYQRDVDKALEPVREEWARKMGANDAD